MRKSKVVAALAILLVVFWILYLTLYHPFNTPVSNCLRCSDSVTVSIKNRRLLYMTASYSMGQFLHLWNSLASLVGICEAGWDVEIGLQVSNGLKLDTTPMRELQASLFCHRTNSIIPINITSFDSIGFGLTTKHRGVASAVIDQFDYFVYAEEDMIFTISHLNAYLSTVRLFESMFGKSLNQYSVGYIRYEDLFADQDRVTWEYVPSKTHVVSSKLPNGGINQLFLVTNNMNQAINVFSRDQLKYLQEKCEFLTKPGLNIFYRELRKALNKDWKYLSVGVSEWSSSFQHVLQCSVRRLIPLSTYKQHFIKHDTGIAHRRRRKAELLNMTSWDGIVDNLLRRGQSSGFKSIEQYYKDEIYHQYNLHLMNRTNIDGKIKYQWFFENH